MNNLNTYNIKLKLKAFLRCRVLRALGYFIKIEKDKDYKEKSGQICMHTCKHSIDDEILQVRDN
jgi:hypothetical protein